MLSRFAYHMHETHAALVANDMAAVVAQFQEAWALFPAVLQEIGPKDDALELNEALFLVLNASDHPSMIVLTLAKLFAVYAIWLVPLTLFIGWLRGSDHTLKLMLEATASRAISCSIRELSLC